MIDYKKTATIIFAYNRPSHFKRVLVSLEDYGLKNFFVFLDGPRNKKDMVIQDEILHTIASIKFAKVKLIKNKSNQGLAKSIMRGVSKVLNKYENIIVIEDDCIPFKNFFSFISNQLETDYFKNYCGAVCSYMFPEISQKDSNKLYPLSLNYFIPWGWATNRENWKNFLLKRKNKKILFKNKTIYSRLINNLNKKNIWTIDFIYHNLQKGKKFIYPNFSLIKNIGFDGSGINSKIDNSLRVVGNKNKNIKISNNILINQRIQVKQETILSSKIKLFY
tara:strand:+ start:523 stop:1353 length:831 start_codon:yes stop_codon:yes gene_type:complete